MTAHTIGGLTNGYLRILIGTILPYSVVDISHPECTGLVVVLFPSAFLRACHSYKSPAKWS